MNRDTIDKISGKRSFLQEDPGGKHLRGGQEICTLSPPQIPGLSGALLKIDLFLRQIPPLKPLRPGLIQWGRLRGRRSPKFTKNH